MPPELITGLIGLLGVVIGAAGAFVASMMTTRAQRLQVAEGRDERQNDVRRDAYAAFLTHVSMFLDRAREIAVALDTDSTVNTYDDLYQRYLGEWRELVGATAAVEVAGPAAVAAAATTVLSEVGGVADVCDNWHRARQREGPVNARWAEHRTAQAAATVAREAFVREAQAWWRDPYTATKIVKRRSGDRSAEWERESPAGRRDLVGTLLGLRTMPGRWPTISSDSEDRDPNPRLSGTIG